MEQNPLKQGAKRPSVIDFTVALTLGTPTKPYYNFAARGVHEHLVHLTDTARKDLLELLVDARDDKPGSIVYTYPVWKQPMRLNVRREGETYKVITRLEDEGTLSIGHSFTAKVVDAWIGELTAAAAPAAPAKAATSVAAPAVPAPTTPTQQWDEGLHDIMPDDALDREVQAELRAEAAMDREREEGAAEYRQVYYDEVVEPYMDEVRRDADLEAYHELLEEDEAQARGPAVDDRVQNAELHFLDFGSKEVVGYANRKQDTVAITLTRPFDRCMVVVNDKAGNGAGSTIDMELVARGFYAHARDAGDDGKYALSATLAQSGRCLVAHLKRGVFSPARDGKVYITAYWRRARGSAQAA